LKEGRKEDIEGRKALKERREGQKRKGRKGREMKGKEEK
jgi:hypothetical protein